ncbi:zinc-binding dehydrogenase [Nocardia sp. NPDC055029]
MASTCSPSTPTAASCPTTSSSRARDERPYRACDPADRGRSPDRHVRLRPVIDREFGFGEVVAADDYLRSGAAFGKVVVSVS